MTYNERPDGPIVSAEKARQAKPGRPVLVVLVSSLVLAGLAWIAVALYGSFIKDPNTAALENRPVVTLDEPVTSSTPTSNQ